MVSKNTKSGIYLIINTINGKFYIGSSCDIPRRFRSHRKCLNKNTHDNIHLQNAWNKYGESNFSFEIYTNCFPNELLLNEQFLSRWEQKTQVSLDLGMNATYP